MGEQVTQVWNDLKFDGHVRNLLGYELKLELASEKGAFTSYHSTPSLPQMTLCEKRSDAGVGYTCCCRITSEDPIQLVGKPDKVGLLNGAIRLIRPSDDLDYIRRYWVNMIEEKQAQVHDFPDMKALRKQPHKTYVIANAGMAIVAYLRHYEELDFVLVPALPISPNGDPAAGFRALIPARYFFDKDPLFYQYDPTRWRPEYEGRRNSV